MSVSLVLSQSPSLKKRFDMDIGSTYYKHSIHITYKCRTCQYDRTFQSVVLNPGWWFAN